MDKAIEYFKRSLEIESSPKTAQLIAKLYFKSGLFPESLEYFDYAIEMATSQNVNQINTS
jgi:tetratricopeptide (TPR) repeat protein